MNNSTSSRAYKHPKVTVVVLGRVDERVVERLSRMLRLHGPKGLRIVVVSEDFTKSIETLRDFLLSNYAFTIELYFTKPGELGKHLGDYRSVVSVLALNPTDVRALPSELRNVVEVL